LQAFNQSVLTAVEAHYKDPSNPYPGEDNDIMFELTPYLEAAGINDPLTKIYVTTRVVRKFSVTHFLFIISQLPKLVYNKTVGSMLCRKLSDPIDGPPFVAGCITLLRQFHSDNTERFLEKMGQYVRSTVDSQIGVKDKSLELSQDAVSALSFLEEFTKYGHVPRRAVERYIPSYIFDEFRHHLQ